MIHKVYDDQVTLKLVQATSEIVGKKIFDHKFNLQTSEKNRLKFNKNIVPTETRISSIITASNPKFHIQKPKILKKKLFHKHKIKFPNSINKNPQTETQISLT